MIIGVLNQKGGVGKTTLSVNIASELARRKSRVLLIDADTQGTALDWASARNGDALVTVVGFPRASLHKEIAKIGHGYDHVIIDGPPRITELARSVVMAVDLVLIPLQPSPCDIWAVANVIELIEDAKVFKGNLKTAFVVNRIVANTAIRRGVTKALANYPISTLKATVTQRVIFAEAMAQGLAVYEVNANSQAAKEIEAVTNELLELI